MSMADIVFPLGMALFAVAVAILAAIFIVTRVRNSERRLDDEDYWQRIKDMPDRHDDQQPPHPDGGTS